MKRYKIIVNIDDHVGYNGEPLRKSKKLPDNYFLMENNNGRQWTCGEEEIQEI